MIVATLCIVLGFLGANVYPKDQSFMGLAYGGVVVLVLDVIRLALAAVRSR
jgi:membrane-bound ClpP family serine protease